MEAKDSVQIRQHGIDGVDYALKKVIKDEGVFNNGVESKIVESSEV